jgi:hypothetical protein
MSVKPRAPSIGNYCQRPGACLTAAQVRHGGGREFYLSRDRSAFVRNTRWKRFATAG